MKPPCLYKQNEGRTFTYGPEDEENQEGAAANNPEENLHGTFTVDEDPEAHLPECCRTRSIERKTIDPTITQAPVLNRTYDVNTHAGGSGGRIGQTFYVPQDYASPMRDFQVAPNIGWNVSVGANRTFPRTHRQQPTRNLSAYQDAGHILDLPEVTKRRRQAPRFYSTPVEQSFKGGEGMEQSTLWGQHIASFDPTNSEYVSPRPPTTRHTYPPQRPMRKGMDPNYSRYTQISIPGGTYQTMAGPGNQTYIRTPKGLYQCIQIPNNTWTGAQGLHHPRDQNTFTKAAPRSRVTFGEHAGNATYSRPPSPAVSGATFNATRNISPPGLSTTFNMPPEMANATFNVARNISPAGLSSTFNVPNTCPGKFNATFNATRHMPPGICPGMSNATFNATRNLSPVGHSTTFNMPAGMQNATFNATRNLSPAGPSTTFNIPAGMPNATFNVTRNLSPAGPSTTFNMPAGMSNATFNATRNLSPAGPSTTFNMPTCPGISNATFNATGNFPPVGPSTTFNMPTCPGNTNATFNLSPAGPSATFHMPTSPGMRNVTFDATRHGTHAGPSTTFSRSGETPQLSATRTHVPPPSRNYHTYDSEDLARESRKRGPKYYSTPTTPGGGHDEGVSISTLWGDSLTPTPSYASEEDSSLGWTQGVRMDSFNVIKRMTPSPRKARGPARLTQSYGGQQREAAPLGPNYTDYSKVQFPDSTYESVGTQSDIVMRGAADETSGCNDKTCGANKTFDYPPDEPNPCRSPGSNTPCCPCKK